MKEIKEKIIKGLHNYICYIDKNNEIYVTTKNKCISHLIKKEEPFPNLEDSEKRKELLNKLKSQLKR